MNRNDYLFILRKNLQSLPLEEIDDIISDVNEHFELGIEAGKSEEAIAHELGDPVFFAGQYCRTNFTKQTLHKQAGNPLNIGLFALIWIVAIGPVIAVYASLVAFIATGVAFIVASFAFVLALFVTTILQIPLLAILSGALGFFILGVSIIRLSSLGMVAFTKYLKKTESYFRNNLVGASHA